MKSSFKILLWIEKQSLAHISILYLLIYPELLPEFEHNIAKFENEDKKEDQIRNMAWFALWGMLLYPVGIVGASWLTLDTAANLLSDIAPTYFVAISALVAAFFGAQAYTKGK